ncbi:hypothetical protein [Streptomyces phaeochromogenes]|uniref:hypothetical protein n=1 Tax=Streptomyces phaeochromogenes TaxID=1923 RepID=UPI0006E4484E|nr:hypothetical protein [Streptomyces phaeochromogenes]
MMLGPNTELGHNSMVFMIEAQARYIVGAIKHAHVRRTGALELRPEVQASAYGQTQRSMRKAVWVSGGCRSWYRSADGRIDTLWPGTTVSYWWQSKRFKPGDYRVTEEETASGTV